MPCPPMQQGRGRPGRLAPRPSRTRSCPGQRAESRRLPIGSRVRARVERHDWRHRAPRGRPRHHPRGGVAVPRLRCADRERRAAARLQLQSTRPSMAVLLEVDLALMDGFAGVPPAAERGRYDAARLPVGSHEHRGSGSRASRSAPTTTRVACRSRGPRHPSACRHAAGEPSSAHRPARLSRTSRRPNHHAHLVTRAGNPVPLSPTEYRLLRYLQKNSARVVSRGRLLDQVWHRDAGGRDATWSTPRRLSQTQDRPRRSQAPRHGQRLRLRVACWPLTLLVTRRAAGTRSPRDPWRRRCAAPARRASCGR